MKKTILSAITVAMISGCAAKYDHHSVLLEQGSSDYKVNLKMETKFKTLNPKAFNTITVYINDQKALKGPLDEIGTGSLEGMYDNKKLELDCAKEGMFDAHSKCVVHLGNIKLGKYEIVQTIE